MGYTKQVWENGSEGGTPISAARLSHMEDGIEGVGLSAMGVVIHGTNASAARPTGYGAVHWIGSVTPTNAIDNDVWTDTSA